MMGIIAAVIATFLLLVLLLPIRYRFSLRKWEISIQLSVFLGLWKKEISFDTSADEDEE